VSSSAGGARLASRLVAVAFVVVVGACAAGDDDGGGSATTGGEGGGPSGEFSVLTYDVAGLPQEVAITARPRDHIPLISPMLNDYDIVLTQDDYDWFVPSVQELDVVNYHQQLRSEATHQFRSDAYPGPVTAGINPNERPQLQLGDGLGVLSRFPFGSRHPLDDVTRVGWTECSGSFDAETEGGGDCVVARGFAQVTIALDNGVPIDVYTFQAEVGETDEDQELQADNFDQLAAYIEQHSGGHAVLLAGASSLDTREGQPDNDIWTQFLERTGLTDACEAVGCEDTDNSDKVAFRNGNGVELTPTAHDVPRNLFVSPEGEDLSYRPPVAARFQWQASG
jgi:hypothetical protein